MRITKKLINDKLKEVLDPELNISIVDLGLIYNIHLKTEAVEERSGKTASVNSVNITMTLTTIGCPLFPIIEKDIKSKLAEEGIPEENVKLELTFDPAWSMDKMSSHAKALLGI